MPAGVRHLVALHDHSVGIDQVADPLGVVGELVVGIAQNLIGGADRFVGVRKQGKRESVGLGERTIVLGCVEGDPENVTAGLLELRGLITQAPSLKRSTGGRRLRIPPHEHPAPTVVRERHWIAMLVVEGELGGFRPGFEHG